ncbi:hypothetical protein GLYMA_16G078750v4 [Glycine max]|nr:hypothetical protein GLYMA_16G078750v4 [Glycine max]KAH1150462.1 hypothetical protein GYH30_044459 [Glycine max]
MVWIVLLAFALWRRALTQGGVLRVPHRVVHEDD